MNWELAIEYNDFVYIKHTGCPGKNIESRFVSDGEARCWSCGEEVPKELENKYLFLVGLRDL